jgi:hypothetical protein
MPKAPQFDMDEEEVLTSLRSMEADPAFVTKSAYRANAEQWPGNRISFVGTHVSYLKVHPSVDPKHYLANLRLMLRKRS